MYTVRGKVNAAARSNDRDLKKRNEHKNKIRKVRERGGGGESEKKSEWPFPPGPTGSERLFRFFCRAAYYRDDVLL